MTSPLAQPVIEVAPPVPSTEGDLPNERFENVVAMPGVSLDLIAETPRESFNRLFREVGEGSEHSPLIRSYFLSYYRTLSTENAGYALSLTVDMMAERDTAEHGLLQAAQDDGKTVMWVRDLVKSQRLKEREYRELE